MPVIKLQEIKLAYEQHGKGMPLLFIHGFPLNRHLWKPQWTALSSAAHVIVPDLRGHGESEPGNTSDYSMDIFARDCFDLIAALRITSPILVCGLSMGGYVAMSMLQTHPERIAGLILTATRSAADTTEVKANRDKSIQTVQKSGSTSIIEGMLPRLFSPQSYSNHPELVHNVKQMMSSISASTIIKDLQGLKERSDSTMLLSASTQPTLIIHGEDDQIVPLVEAQSLQHVIPGAHFIKIPEAGHLPNLEQSKLFNTAVLQFIRSIPYENK